MGKTCPRIPVAEGFISAYRAGVTLRHLELQFGVSNTVLHRWVRVCGLQPRKHILTADERWQSFRQQAIHDENGCWLWPGLLTPNGYGFVSVTGKRVLLHRFAWKMTYGVPLGNKLGCHKCDVPRCFNPDHLFDGTQKENIQDCVNKNRHARARTTHCPAGHEYCPGNIKWHHRKDGSKSRVCRTCVNEKQNRRYHNRNIFLPNAKTRKTPSLLQGKR